MFFHILERDLKRKKTMNVVLLLFIILATMFLSSSTNNLLTVNGAVERFLDISNVPDWFAVAVEEEGEDSIENFLKENEYVSEYGKEQGFNLLNEQITITKRQSASDKTSYERTNTLFLQKVPEHFMKIFPMEGETISLKKGEIAIPKLEADNNDLQVGDKLRIKVGEKEQEFTIVQIVRDAVFGTPFMAMKRLVISDEDFAEFKEQENVMQTNVYSANCKDGESFRQMWNQENFQIISTIEGRETIAMCYVMDKLVSVVLIVVSICLILIAFLVLRFTIVFTLQEDYKEIGIMKAIGIKDRGIKGIYLVKYCVLAVVGAAIGFLCSFPFGNILLKVAVVNIKIEKAGQNRWLNLVCAAAVICIVLLFCYTSTNRLKKISVMDAIRNGSNGERFHTKNHLKLWKRKQMKPYFYLALNDILSNGKRFGVLAIIFCLGAMLILLPLGAVHTLKSDNIIYSCSLCLSDVYIDNGQLDTYVGNKDITKLLDDMTEMEETLKEHGIEVKTGSDIGYMIPCYAEDEEKKYSYYILQTAGSWERHYRLLEGREPELANEVIVTDITAREMGVNIGDTIHFIMEEDEEFIITGTYQSLMNMGQGFRVSRNAKLGEEYLAGIFCMQVEAEGLEAEAAKEKIKEIFPEYQVMNTGEFINKMIGGVKEQLDVLIAFITILVLFLNSLITALMMKTMMTKERGDIALLKSIGFSNRSVKAWQAARIAIVLVTAVVLGTVLTELLSPYTIVPIFGMMGANQIELIHNPLEAYVIYPALLLTVTVFTAYVCAGGIRKVDLKEVNSME